MKPRKVLMLPKDLRQELKKPLGTVKRDFEEIADILRKKNPKRIISVGDFVSFRLLEAGISPDVMIIDRKIKRAATPQSILDALSRSPHQEIRVKNAAGTLNPELWDVLEKISGKVRIVVDGEEDLAAIPAVLASPEGSIVLYGLPDTGTVIVDVTEETKRMFSEILKRFVPLSTQK